MADATVVDHRIVLNLGPAANGKAAAGLESANSGPTLGQRYFGDCDLGDKRRTKRLVSSFDLMCLHPGGSLPDMLPAPKALDAFYILMDAEQATHAKLLESSQSFAATRINAALSGGSTVLIIHDATELDYTKRSKLAPFLSQIGQGTHQGYICHNSLAVEAGTGAVLGLANQILHHRADVPEGETVAQSRDRESRESLLWIHGVRGCPATAAGLVVDVCDSLSDTFEFLSYEASAGRLFLIRSREDRRLAEPIGGHTRLYPAVRAWEAAAAGYKVVVPPSKENGAGRTAEVSVSFGQVLIAPPGKQLGHYENTPRLMWAVRVWEPHPPAGIKRLEWILLTNVPVLTLADALERTDWYKLRSRIEDWHKAMKTGCRIEQMQFDKLERLEPAILILSLAALLLLDLRDQARRPDADTRPATEIVPVEYVAALQDYYPDRLGDFVSVNAFFMHVARLGGHQNRKGDGLPGWITIWRGWKKLSSMAAARRAQGQWRRQNAPAA